MNYKNLGKILGKIMIMEGLLMLAPLLVSLIYGEDIRHKLAFLLPAILLGLLGGALQLLDPKRTFLYQKEGFALVAIAWIVMGAFGALPLVISRDVPGYIDAFFEVVSGFTTTGASVIADITKISHSVLFWRSFTHWIGGMGILVFILIFIPESNEGSSMHLLRAESPGPQVGKIVSKMKMTTRILYLIYFGMTVLEFVLLLFARPIPGYESDKVFFSLLSSFGCAGTGGFGVVPGSIELFSPYAQYVMAIFMLLFGANFALYYLLLIGKVKDVLRSVELKAYGLIIVSAIALVFIGLVTRIQAFPQTYTTEEAFRHALFQVSSLVTTTGYTTTDFGVWPALCTTVLLLLMFIGAMAGSTAGGIKTSRIVIALKGMYIEIRKLINPHYVPKAKFEGKTLPESTMKSVFSFLSLYLFVLLGAFFLLSFDAVNGQTVKIVSDAGEYIVKHGSFSNFSAVVACLSNVGPAFEAVGPYASYASYSWFSKIVLSFTMLIGRLEILPVFVLFSPKTWKKT